MAEETKEVEVKEDPKPDVVSCGSCGKMIYNGEKCSCQVSKDKHDR